MQEHSPSHPMQRLKFGRIPVVDVWPVVGGGDFPAKAVPGEDIEVAATVFREGHDKIGATAVLFDPDGNPVQRARLTPGGHRHRPLARQDSPPPAPACGPSTSKAGATTTPPGGTTPR